MRIFISFLLIIFSCSAVYADNQQNQLDHIVQQIKNIRSNLLANHHHRNSLQQQLDQIETQYGEASKQLQVTEQEINARTQKVTKLTKSSLTNQKQIQNHQQSLLQQLRLTYFLQSQDPIKVFLNQQDWEHAQRMLNYYRTLNRYRFSQIQQLQENLNQINSSEQDLLSQIQELKKLKQQQQEQEQKLVEMKNNRAQLIASINLAIHDQRQQLIHLTANKQQLEHTLANLQTTATQQKIVYNNNNKPFMSLRGHLPWPTKGAILHYFNTSIANSELKWSGELIAAPDEQPVYAIASGTVVFSKWLEGYGLLIIINHGDGYMSLYGRNHSLYKHEGDNVSAGDLIATVGQSGGYDKPALYFAIRYNAKPLDPNQWCA